MPEALLGIGSRVKHPQFGMGVIIQIRPDAYEITFIEQGTRNILRDYQGMEIIEAVEGSLRKIDGIAEQAKKQRFAVKMEVICEAAADQGMAILKKAKLSDLVK